MSGSWPESATLPEGQLLAALLWPERASLMTSGPIKQNTERNELIGSTRSWEQLSEIQATLSLADSRLWWIASKLARNLEDDAQGAKYRPALDLNPLKMGDKYGDRVRRFLSS